MGDWLRYALFDKYFKTMGCTAPEVRARQGLRFARTTCCPGTTRGAGRCRRRARGRSGFGASSAQWRLPEPAGGVRAVARCPTSSLASPNAARDWKESLDRQLAFYHWLQSAEGGIAGGATNSWNGRYEQPPAGTPTFYGMAYYELLVYHDPPEQRVVRVQGPGRWIASRSTTYVTGDARAKVVLDKLGRVGRAARSSPPTAPTTSRRRWTGRGSPTRA